MGAEKTRHAKLVLVTVDFGLCGNPLFIELEPWVASWSPAKELEWL